MRKESHNLLSPAKEKLIVTGIIIGISILSLMSAKAQTLSAHPEQGAGAAGGYQTTNIDSISLQNGGVSLSIPLASLPPIAGGKLSYTLTASYNSKLWSMLQKEVRYSIHNPGCPPSYSTQEMWPAEGSGWTIGGQYQIFYRDANEDYDYIEPDSEQCFGYEWYYMQGRFFKPMLRMPDGSEHELRFQSYIPTYSGQGTRDHLKNYYQQPGSGGPGEPFFSSTVRMHTIDGTFITIEANPSSSTIYSTIYFKDGTRIENSTEGQRTIDPNGNSILQGYNTTGSYFFAKDEQTDREIKWYGSTYNGQTATKVDYQAVGGDWKSVYVVYGTSTVKGKVYGKTSENFDLQGETCYTSQNLPDNEMTVVREIVLPQTESNQDPQKFTFAYNSDDTEKASDNLRYFCSAYQPTEDYVRDASIGWGEISKISIPTGAEIEYEYSHDHIHTFSQSSPYDSNEPVKDVITKKKITHDGNTDEWTYDVNPGLSTQYSGGSVTNPDGSSHSELYNPADIAYSGRGGDDGMGGLLLRSTDSGKIITEKKWTALGGFAPSFGSTNLNGVNRVVDTEFTTLYEGTTRLKMNAKKYQYDYNGNVTQIIEYDWFDPSIVSFPNNNYNAIPNAVPSGATVLRVTNTSYYNQALNSSSSNAYTTRDITPTGRVLLGYSKETTVGDGSSTKSITQLSYDGNAYGTVPNKGMITKISNWDDVGSQWIDVLTGYDSYGNITSKTDPNGNVTNIYYDDGTHAMPTSTTVDPENGTGTQTISTTYDYYTGLPLTSTDVNGVTSSISYTNMLLGAVDPFGRPGVTYGPYITIDGVSQRCTTKTYYEDNARRTRVEADLFSEGDARIKNRNARDQLGRPILVEENEDGASSYTISSQTIYGDAADRVVLTSNAKRTGSASTDGWTRTTRDAQGRSIEVASFSGTSQPPVNGTNPNWTGSVTTSYSANTITVTDQAGKIRRSVVNGLGQLIRLDEPNDSGQLDVNGIPVQSTAYSYDVLGNLTQVIQGNQIRSFTYSSMSRLLTVTNPEMGTTPTNGTIYYEYDATGNLTEKTDPRNIVTTYSYDALNRITARNYSDSTPDVSYTYENNGIANSKGKLTVIDNGFSKTEYTGFDILGRITQSKQTTDGTAYDPMTYKYNLSGAMVEQKYPSGRVVKNVLDNGGGLLLVQSKENSATGFWDYASNFTYNSAGAVTSMQLGNGRWESTQFNSRMQPTQIALGGTSNTTNLLDLDYEYGDLDSSGAVLPHSNNGNIAKQTITVSSGFSAVQKYDYDSLNRISIASETLTPIGQSPTQTWVQGFSYDRYGNRMFNEAITTTLPHGCTEEGNQVVCSADKKVLDPSVSVNTNRINRDQDGDSIDDYIFDNAGNTTKMADGRTFVYDGENKLTEVWNGSQRVGEYFYDGDGKRVKKKAYNQYGALTETTIFVYDASGRLAAEYSTALNPIQQVSYLTNDHLGSPRINTDQNGAIIARHDYHPFGEEIVTSQRTAGIGYTSDDIRKQFTRYERDDETGLDYAQARYFKPGLGRFTSIDPLHSSANVGDAQSWNRYSYALNNPLTFTDPSGMFIWSRNLGGDADDDHLEEFFTKEANKISDPEKRRKALKKVAERVKQTKEKRKMIREAIDQAKALLASGNLSESQKAELNRSFKAYGDEFQNNNVILGLGGGTGGATQFAEDGRIVVTLGIGINDSTRAIEFLHEGSHLADYQAFNRGDAGSDLDDYATESRAWTVSAYASKALGFDRHPSALDEKLAVWKKGWSEEEIAVGVANRLAGTGYNLDPKVKRGDKFSVSKPVQIQLYKDNNSKPEWNYY